MVGDQGLGILTGCPGLFFAHLVIVDNQTPVFLQMAKTKSKLLPAKLIYDNYPHGDLLPVCPPRKGESLEHWEERCAVSQQCGDGLFRFIVRELIECGDGGLQDAGRLLSTA